jgi:formiminotetrahydrofolate cyclodeaminase
MKICPSRADLFHADEQTDMAKLVVAFRNFARAPKKLPPHTEREKKRRSHCASAAGSMATSSAERHSEGRGEEVE